MEPRIAALYLASITFISNVYQMVFISMSTRSTDIYGLSFDECKSICLDRPACGAVELNRHYQRCRLFSRDMKISGDFSRQPGCFQKPVANNSSIFSNRSIFFHCAEDGACTTTGCTLPVVSNGVVYGNLMKIGTTIQLVCDSGFHPLNETSAICGQDGRWAPTLQCIIAYNCGSPPDIPNADVEMTSAFVAEYRCMSGYQPVGNDNISTCLSPFGWISSSLNCLKMCGDPPIVPNTAVSYAPNIEGNIVTYTCLDGFAGQNGLTSDKSICGSDGNWTNVELLCLSDCGALPSISNGYFSAGGDSVGSVRQYTCDGDHTNNGQRTGSLECSPQGTWQPSDSINCKELQTLGKFCMKNDTCKEPNTTCFRSRCTCKPLYKFSFTGDYCFETCNSLLDNFTQINKTYIGWFWTDNITLSNTQTCKDVCIANQTCLIYEHLHAHEQDCRFGTLSLQQFQDALPDKIDYDFSSSKLFVRDCVTI